jgi:hypothetical protein
MPETKNTLSQTSGDENEGEMEVRERQNFRGYLKHAAQWEERAREDTLMFMQVRDLNEWWDEHYPSLSWWRQCLITLKLATIRSAHWWTLFGPPRFYLTPLGAAVVTVVVCATFGTAAYLLFA